MRRWALLATLTLTGIGLWACGRDDAWSLIDDLGHSVSGRPFRARLALDVPYAPCPSGSGPRCSPLPRPGTAEFTRLADASQRVVTAVRSGARGADRAQGLVELLWYDGGAEKGLRRALKRLEESLGTDSSARSLNDLAVGHLLRADERHTPFDLVEALDLVERAVAADSTLDVARFNRALLLERFSLLPEAAEAWGDYLRLDGDSPWADEARAHRDSVLQQVTEASRSPADLVRDAVASGDSTTLVATASAHPQAARELGFDEVLTSWGDRWLVGDTSAAARSLRAARLLGAPLVDRSLADAVARIQAHATNPAARARAHQAFGEGRRRYEQGDLPAASEAFRRATRDLVDPSDPLRVWATVWLGTASFISLSYDRATTQFTWVTHQADRHHWPSLWGRAVWGLGLIKARQGIAEDSWSQLDRAAERFERAGERQNASYLRMLTAESLNLLGRPQDAWRDFIQALSGQAVEPVPRRLHNVLWEAADGAGRLGYPMAAMVFQNADIRVAGPTYAIAEARERRARLFAQLGAVGPARKDLDIARQRLGDFPQEGNRRILLAAIQLTEAGLDMGQAPRRSIALLDSVIAFDRAADNGNQTADALRLRARARRMAGDREAAAADLTEALAEIEYRASSMEPGADVSTVAATAQAVVSELTAFRLFTDGEPDAALAVHEGARRFVLGLPPDQRATAGKLSRLFGTLPPDMVVLEYAILGDTVALWTLTNTGARAYVLQRPATRLERDARAFVRAITAERSQEVDSLGRSLFASLFPPEAVSLMEGRALVVVPDGFLGGIPFAALKDPASGRYAVETWPLTIAPYAGFIVDALERSRHSREGETLLVGEPSLDHTALPGLARLPGARQEVEAIRSMYPTAVTVEGGEATPSILRSALRGATLFHYAGHAVYDADLPSASRLVLASADGAPADFVYARELERWPLGSLRLVVLSACSSVTPSRMATGGFWGLAQPFLTAGVESVVGTLWEVGDESTRDLMTTFHRAWLDGSDSATALQTAQLALLRDPSGRFSAPRFWAATQAIGLAP